MSFSSNIETMNLVGRPYMVVKGSINNSEVVIVAWAYALHDEDDEEESYVWRAEMYLSEDNSPIELTFDYSFSLQTEEEALLSFEKWATFLNFEITHKVGL